MKRQISHTIEIEASPADVWAILTDSASFPAWNTFMHRLDGELRTGAKLSVTVQPPGHRSSTFHPTVLAVEPGRELRWIGRVLIPGIFDGEHGFLLEPTSAGHTRFTQMERFSGVLVRPFSRTIDRTETGFRQMNEALKARAEDVERRSARG